MPIYMKIYEDLRYQILSGKLPSGAELPIDAELEKMYGVSRSPVRQALGRLSDEGLVVRSAGRRTYVADNIKPYQWAPSTGFERLFAGHWDSMTGKTFIADLRVPPPSGRVFLRTGEDDKVVHMLRARYLSQKPLMSTRTFLAPEYRLPLFAELGNILALREVLYQYFGRSFKKVHESLAVRSVPQEEAEILEVPAGTLMLEIERFVTDDRGLPMLYNLRYACTDEWRYEVDF